MPIENLYNEPELLLRIAEGDQQAFAAVYQQWFRSVYYFAARFVPEGPDAEDITSVIFQKLWQQRGHIRTSMHLKSFLFTSTRNACIDFLRAARRSSEKEAEMLQALQQWDDPTLDEQGLIAELMKLLEAEVARLPAQTARIFNMAFLEAKTNPEIADILGVGEHTVRNQKSYALRQLRIALQYAWLPACFVSPFLFFE